MFLLIKAIVNVVRKVMLYSSKLDTVHIINTMKIIFKISNTLLVKVIFIFVPGRWVRPRDCEPCTR